MYKIEISGKNFTPDLYDDAITQDKAIQRMGEIGGNIRESVLHHLIDINAHVDAIGVDKKGWSISVTCGSIMNRMEVFISLQEKFSTALNLNVIKMDLSEVKDTTESFRGMCRQVYEEGLVRYTSGNASMRTDNGILITRSGSCLGNIKRADLVFCNYEGETGGKPSTELPFHLALYQEREDVNIVLHFQSPFATALSCLDRNLGPFDVIPEVTYYIGSDKIGRVSYHHPGSEALAEGVMKAAQNNIILLNRHGVIAVGSSEDEVLKRAIFFELACEILFRMNSLTDEPVL